MTQQEFIELAESKGATVEIKDGKIHITTSRRLNLESLTSFTGDVVFNVGEWLDLGSVTSFTGDVVFNVGEWLNLGSVTSFTGDVVFNVGEWLNLGSVTSFTGDVVFNVGGRLNLESLTSFTEGVVFNVGGRLSLRSVKWAVKNCGDADRSIVAVMQQGRLQVSLGCFHGTEDEAIEAISGKYSRTKKDEYISKVKEAFEIARRFYKIVN
jgi:hypothetical protein